MKHFAFLIAVLISSGTLFAQEISQPMKKFLEGCMAMRTAVENNDFASLTDAKLALSSVKLTEFSEADFTPIDSASIASICAPQIYFTPGYANKLVKAGVISMEAQPEDAHFMRDGDFDLQLWHASIKPRSEVTFISKGVFECEMLLFSLTGSNLNLIVKYNDSIAKSINPLNDNTAWLSTWSMSSTPSEFTFTIINDSDNQASFVIAIN